MQSFTWARNPKSTSVVTSITTSGATQASHASAFVPIGNKRMPVILYCNITNSLFSSCFSTDYANHWYYIFGPTADDDPYMATNYGEQHFRKHSWQIRGSPKAGSGDYWARYQA